MSSIKFSASSSASAATSITVALGGSPAVGDLVLVFLLVDNEILIRQPGYGSEFTATPNPWFKLEGLRAPDTSSFTGWCHTWNASDSGTSVTFTFSPAPALGIGDKDIPSANALAIAVVFNGASSTALLEHNAFGLGQDFALTIPTSPMKKAASMNIVCAAANNSLGPWTNSDTGSTLVLQTALNAGDGLTMALWSKAATGAGYHTSITLVEFDGARSLLESSVSVSDNLPQLYNPPFIEEGPMGNNPLMYRYRLNRYFTVLNNGGTFSAHRFLSTDEIAAATQVFTNNQPITPTDRTNILNSGVGGDFQAVT
jgi:hypothetical protein